MYKFCHYDNNNEDAYVLLFIYKQFSGKSIVSPALAREYRERYGKSDSL